MKSIIIKLIALIYGSLKTFGLFHGIRKIVFTSVYKRLSDPLMADHVYAKSSYQYLEKFYRRHNKKNVFNRPSNDIHEHDFIYWTCWLQGIEYMPDIVKACVNSLRKYANGRRIIIITYENMEKYISLPSFIIEKHKKGYMQAAHFSDILRTYLLYTYGGAWFDATVFFTGNIPDDIIKRPLFLFRSHLNDQFNPAGNWFIVANGGKNELLFKELCILCEYWRLNNKIIDYFIFHYFMQVIINDDSQCEKIFNAMPYWNDQNPHYLQLRCFFLDFNHEIWENIKSISFCHKLTYKFKDTSLPKKPATYYEYIIKSNTVDDNQESGL